MFEGAAKFSGQIARLSAEARHVAGSVGIAGGVAGLLLGGLVGVAAGSISAGG